MSLRNFFKPSHRSTLPNEVEENFKAAIATQNPKNQKSYLQQFQAFCQAFKPVIEQLNTEEKIISFLDRCTEALKNANSYLQATKEVAPVAAVSFLTSAAAESFKSIPGAAPGYSDLCNGLLNCVQWYLLNAGGEVAARYNAFVDMSTGGAAWVFDLCFKQSDTISKIVMDILATNGTDDDILSPCSATYTASGLNLKSQVHELGTKACLAYQNYLNTEASNCMTESKLVGYNLAISVICIAGIIACGCACYAYLGYQALKKCVIL